MNFLELATSRYSERNYASKPIEREKIEYILHAAQIAPSAVNYQPWNIIVVTQAEMLQKLYACYPRDWFNSVQACIIVVGNHEQSWKRKKDEKEEKDYCDIDCAIAIDHMSLAAIDQGLATCWICNFDLEICKELLELDAHLEPIALLSLGYPSEIAPPIKKRKKINEITRWIE